MIKEVKIENFKSIDKLKLELGRVTVLIGENGCGKSNILEAIAFASAAAGDKLDNEFLVSRGIRVTDPQFMRAAFDSENTKKDISICLEDFVEERLKFILSHENKPYSKWRDNGTLGINTNKMREFINSFPDPNFSKNRLPQEAIENWRELLTKREKKITKKLHNFLIYSPENPALRTFEREGQIQPLGIKGEGIFKLLKVLSLQQEQSKIQEIKEKLRLIDWFEDFKIPHLSDFEQRLQIKDKYLDPDLAYFDQKSSNEGFLFLLFYFTLFISDETPNFFAIDNIDASLNPRLCRRLIQELVELAEKHDKQVIFTTHNPAVLDGLNLEDDTQRLYVINRNLSGHTKAKRILSPQPLEGQEPVKLSEAFLRGYIGGLPKNF